MKGALIICHYQLGNQKLSLCTFAYCLFHSLQLKHPKDYRKIIIIKNERI